MAEIANYDQNDYDYKTYWEGRDYEHKAEYMALSKLLRGKSGKRFMDIGGSFGRNLPLYAEKYDEIVILDYSLKTLLKYEKGILEKFPNAKLVAANVYNMPFIKSSFDGAMMIRVLHHIEEPSKYFAQLAKVLANGGSIFQEFANKMHIKAKIKWLLKGKFNMFDKSPYQQVTRTEPDKEGSTEESIFLNFHPKHVREMMEDVGIMLTNKSGCSFLRSPILKKYLPTSILMFIESMLQASIGWTNIPPSVIFEGTNITVEPDNTSKEFNEILICPKCAGKLTISASEAICVKCEEIYTKHSTVWDLRV